MPFPSSHHRQIDMISYKYKNRRINKIVRILKKLN